MTEVPARPAPHRPPGPLAIAAAGVAVFLVVLTFLALQVRAGKEPAVGTADAEPAVQPRRVVVRRVIERRVVVRRSAAPGSAGPAASGGVTPGGTPSGAPSPAAPPTPAPTPAPAPAPVVSRAS